MRLSLTCIVRIIDDRTFEMGEARADLYLLVDHTRDEVVVVDVGSVRPRKVSVFVATKITLSCCGKLSRTRISKASNVFREKIK